MKMNVTAFALAAGLFWGAAILIMSSANLVWPTYGRAFLEVVASMYPGFRPGAGVSSVVIATIYALVDGVASGAVFAWLHNVIAQLRARAAS